MRISVQTPFHSCNQYRNHPTEPMCLPKQNENSCTDSKANPVSSGSFAKPTTPASKIEESTATAGIDDVSPSTTYTSPRKLKKAPGAPRRFKSAFIFFSTWKHKQIKNRLQREGTKQRMVNVAKMVSEAWRNLSPDERRVWDEKARLDKQRFEIEKSMYNGPWKVEASPRTATKKDPTAPKKPMSAYLSYSNHKRTMIKKMHPNVSNAEVSKILASMWREAPEDVRRSYIDEEARLREMYKAEIKAWRSEMERKKAKERTQRENMALMTLLNRQQQELLTSNLCALRGGDSGSGSNLFDEFPQALLKSVNQSSLSGGLALPASSAASELRALHTTVSETQQQGASAAPAIPTGNWPQHTWSENITPITQNAPLTHAADAYDKLGIQPFYKALDTSSNVTKFATVWTSLLSDSLRQDEKLHKLTAPAVNSGTGIRAFISAHDRGDTSGVSDCSEKFLNDDLSDDDDIMMNDHTMEDFEDEVF